MSDIVDPYRIHFQTPPLSPTTNEGFDFNSFDLKFEKAMIAEKLPAEIRQYLRSSEFRVPPMPSELTDDGEPNSEHLIKNGGALKPGRAWSRYPNQIDFNNLNMSFGGCGFLGMYHVGVMKAIKHFVPNSKINKICGTSAGAMAGSAFIGNIDCDSIASYVLNGVKNARMQFGKGLAFPHGIMDRILEETLEGMLPENIHILAQGRLFVSVTDTKTNRNVILSNFNSKKSLVQAILASSRIPLFTGLAPVPIQKTGCIDGGLTSNLPQFLKNVITVSPFASNAHISPLDNGKDRQWPIQRFHFADQGIDITLANMARLVHVALPPSESSMIDMFHQGFLDACRFLRTNGIISCLPCLQVNKLLTTNDNDMCNDLQKCDQFQVASTKKEDLFDPQIQSILDLNEELEKEATSSISYVLAKSVWSLAINLTPLGLVSNILGLRDYLDNPGKILQDLAEWNVEVLTNVPSDKRQKLETVLGEFLKTLLPNHKVETVQVDHVQSKVQQLRKIPITKTECHPSCSE